MADRDLRFEVHDCPARVLTLLQGLTQLSESYSHGEDLRRWRQLEKVDVALRYEDRAIIVSDVSVPQVLETLIEVAKFIPYEQLMDPLTSHVSFVSIFLNIVSEPFHELMEDAGSNADCKFPVVPDTNTVSKGHGRT